MLISTLGDPPGVLCPAGRQTDLTNQFKELVQLQKSPALLECWVGQMQVCPQVCGQGEVDGGQGFVCLHAKFHYLLFTDCLPVPVLPATLQSRNRQHRMFNKLLCFSQHQNRSTFLHKLVQLPLFSSSPSSSCCSPL